MIETREDIKESLLYVFNYYKEKYGLRSLSFKYSSTYNYGSCFEFSRNRIILSEQDIYESFNDKIFLSYLNNPKSMYELFIKTLLHEIKHAIQFLYNWKICKESQAKKKLLTPKNCILSFKEIKKQYRLIPSEKEADEFANEEWEKWR